MIEKLISIIPLALPFTCIILIAAFYAIVFRKKIWETVFLSIGTIILILFFCGILNFRGSLLLGYIIVVLCSLISMIFCIRECIKNKRILKEISFFPGLVIFLLFLSISFYINYDRLFFHWDEFSHWGIVVKSMYSFDALGSYNKARLMYSAYLPGMSLISYFFCRPFSVFTEYPAYMAQNLLFFSIIGVFFKKYDFKNLLFLMSSLLIPLLMDSAFYSSLYVDCMLGVLFGSIFLFHHHFDFPDSTFSVIILSLSAALLTLTKDMGVIFAGIAIMIVIIDTLMFKKDELNLLNKHKTLNWKKVLILLIPIFSVLLTRIVWMLHLKIANVKNIVIESAPTDFTEVLSKGISPYNKGILRSFLHALKERPVLPLQLSMLDILPTLLIAIIVLVLILRVKNIRRIRLFFTFSGIIIGYFIYSFFMAVYYSFIAPSYVALILSSYERYMFSYLLGIFFVFLLFLIKKTTWVWENENMKSVAKQFIMSISAIILFLIFNFLVTHTRDSLETEILDARDSVQTTIEQRRKYNNILVWSKYLKNEKYNTYIVSQQDRGFNMLMISYVLYPSKVEWKGIYNFSVATEPYYPELNDPWTMIITSNDWEKYVLDNNYDFLFLFEYDEKFSNNYGKYFDKLGNNALYEVTLSNNSELVLKSVPIPEF